MIDLLLIGAGGHANSCFDVIETTKLYNIVGLIEKDQKLNLNHLNYPIIGLDKDLKNLRKKYDHAFITIGQIKTPIVRKKLYNLLNKLKYNIPTIISPHAYVSENAKIGSGSIIMHGSIINSNSTIGDNCIINTKALIEHDVIIGNNCHISTGAIINGEVSVGDETFIGSGCVTKNSISIGNNCVIGSGLSIKENVKSNLIIKN